MMMMAAILIMTLVYKKLIEAFSRRNFLFLRTIFQTTSCSLTRSHPPPIKPISFVVTDFFLLKKKSDTHFLFPVSPSLSLSSLKKFKVLPCKNTKKKM